jgi:hypothetical protein
LAQPLERRHYLAEHLRGAERFTAAGPGDGIMQVEDVDAIAAQPRQACQ